MVCEWERQTAESLPDQHRKLTERLFIPADLRARFEAINKMRIAGVAALDVPKPEVVSKPVRQLQVVEVPKAA